MAIKNATDFSVVGDVCGFSRVEAKIGAEITQLVIPLNKKGALGQFGLHVQCSWVL